MRVKNYKSYPEALDDLARQLRARSFDPDEYYIVLTPDRYTQGVERALFGGGGAIDCEVLTLSRLARRIAGNGAGLSREAGVMLTAGAIAEVKDKLTYYSRAAGYTDFARSVYDAFTQIRASDQDIASLKAGGVTRSKLNDLALIKNKYDKLKGDGADASDRLEELAAAIPDADLIKNAHVYAIGYSQGGADTTRLNKRVFDVIENTARSFLYLRALPPAAPREEMEIFCAPDRIAEYKQVATGIRKYIHEGGAYGDVSVICTEPRALYRILREYGIPFYGDEAEPLSDTPPLTALSYIYKLKSSSDSDTVIALCKNPYSDCDEEDAQKLQAYLTEHGISYGALDKNIDDEAAARAAARIKLLVETLSGNFAEGVEAVLEKGEFCRIRNECDPLGTDAVSPVSGLTDLLKKYGTGNFDSDAASFFSAARAVDIKSLPRERNRVSVTVPQTLRLSACKLLFVTGFNEGVLPVVTADTGLLSDTELEDIQANGGCVEPTALEQNRRNRAELAAVIYNAQKVFCSYVTTGNARPAAIMETLAKRIIRKDHAELFATLKATDDAELIADYACVDGAARELAARGAVKHTASLRAATAEVERKAQPFENSIGQCLKNTISVSELTHWFKCPYKRFLSDSVGLKERRTAELGAPDFGIIVHEFMYKFIEESAGGEYDCSRANVARIIDEVMPENVEFEPEVKERIIDDAVDYAVVNARIIEAGDYKPELFETWRKEGTITLGKNNVKFVGIIDRVDVCGGKARIVDYKTGNKKFDIDECLNGNDMQLPLYSAALGMPVTGMFYVRLLPRYDNRDRAMSGCMIKEIPIAVEYDRTVAEVGASEILPIRTKTSKDGSTEFYGGASRTLLEKAEFDSLMKICVQTASLAVDEIQSGYIARTPVAGACEHCAYRGICGNTVLPRGDAAEEETE